MRVMSGVESQLEGEDVSKVTENQTSWGRTQYAFSAGIITLKDPCKVWASLQSLKANEVQVADSLQQC